MREDGVGVVSEEDSAVGVSARPSPGYGVITQVALAAVVADSGGGAGEYGSGTGDRSQRADELIDLMGD
ncbi:MAG: hypothetical protein GXP62_17665, partial [Oligoflexia bacterium]|nr:hypothetical protein [Oligoflexia bacterium]